MGLQPTYRGYAQTMQRDETCTSVLVVNVAADQGATRGPGSQVAEKRHCRQAGMCWWQWHDRSSTAMSIEASLPSSFRLSGC
jgi:hypothetical protein